MRSTSTSVGTRPGGVDFRWHVHPTARCWGPLAAASTLAGGMVAAAVCFAPTHFGVAALLVVGAPLLAVAGAVVGGRRWDRIWQSQLRAGGYWGDPVPVPVRSPAAVPAAVVPVPGLGRPAAGGVELPAAPLALPAAPRALPPAS